MPHVGDDRVLLSVQLDLPSAHRRRRFDHADTKRNDDVALPDRKEQIHHLGLSKLSGGILIVAWLVIWIAVASVVNTSDYDGNEELYWFEAFTARLHHLRRRPGGPSLLLKDVVQYEDVCAGIDGSIIANATASTVCTSYVQVPREFWITEEQFFAGLRGGDARPVVQPLRVHRRPRREAGINVLAGIFAAWFGLFGPGVMLIYGVLPFWARSAINPCIGERCRA